MKPADKIKKLISKSNVTTDFQTDKRILGDALEYMGQLRQKESAGNQPNIWSIIMKSRTTKIAAAAVIIGAFGSYLFFGWGQATIYAQVIEAIENARTIHAVTKSLNNGQWEKDAEVWYENGKGIVETGWRNGEKTLTRIDNGQYSWEYHAGNDYARRSNTIDPIGVARKLLNVDSFKKQAIRESDKDKIVDGTRYIAYVLSSPQNNYRILTWLDETNRVRGWEKIHLLDNGQWETYRIGEVEYNIVLNPKVFTPNFGEDVKIVELDNMLDLYSDLDEALFTREELGLIFAVHELVRCEGDLIFAISSIRPIDTWRKRVGSSDSAAWNYGSYHFGSAWKRFDNYGRGRSFQQVDLGEIYYAGLQVKWTLFFPQGFEPEGPEECEFEVYLSTIGSLRDKRTKEGLPTEQRFKPMAILPLPKEQTALQQIMDATYSSLLELEPFAACDSLTLKSVPFTDEEMEEYIKEYPDSGETLKYRSGDRSKLARLHHGRSTKPSEISKEDWVKDRMDYLQKIKKNYKDFLEEVQKREQRSK